MPFTHHGRPRAVLAKPVALATLLCALLMAALAAGAGSASARAGGPVAGSASAGVAGGPVAGAARLGPAPAAQRLDLALPLVADVSGLERYATAVSTVGSPDYGHYRSIAVLAQRFGAPAWARARVTSYLRRVGASGVRIDPTGLFADATVTVATAQRLFGTSLARYGAAHASGYVAPASAARLPAALRGVVSGVVGLDTRPVATAPQLELVHGSFHSEYSGYEPRTGTGAGCTEASNLQNPGFTPNQYLTAFGYAPLQAQHIQGQGERVALIEIDGFRFQDIRTFAGCFGLRVPRINGYGVGLRHPLAPGGESTLDLEVLDAAAPGLKEIDVYESRSHAVDVLRSLTAPLVNRGKLPQVISASLGACEPELAAAVGPAGVRAIEGALAAEAAAGISVLASSGDLGSEECLGRSGPIDALAQSFPASSPFVTAVGGTNITLNPNNEIIGEVAWNDEPNGTAAGGGGPSALFRRPVYQNRWVSIRHRVVPDVSLLADVAPGYDIYCSVPGVCINSHNSSSWLAVGGTSAASPLLAGGLALVDQVLRANGRVQLGQANSMLYKAAAAAPGQAFLDVQQGSNDLSPYIGNRVPLGCCSAGPGFDWATGLGSPNLSVLAQTAVSLSPQIATVGLSVPRQHPLRSRRLYARVWCSRRCWMQALASVGARGHRPFTVRSGIYRKTRRGRHMFVLSLSRGEVRRIRGWMRHHGRVYATIYGAVVDTAGNVERLSRFHRVRIR